MTSKNTPTDFKEKILFFFKNIKFPLLFLCLFFIGLSKVKDYGVAYDEFAQRLIGQVNYEYVFNHDNLLLEFEDRYYSSFYEIILFAGEKYFQLKDSRDFLLFRHYINFSLFYSGCIAFFFLIQNIWEKRLLSLLGFFVLFFNPRIFADSIYNTKDIPFLVFYVFCCLALLLYIEKKGKKQLVILSILTGLTISLRLVGALIFFLTCFALLFSLLRACLMRKKELMTFFSHIALFLFISLGVLYTCWPILWSDPTNIFRAASVMGHYPWYSTVLFMGKLISTKNIPWYYLPVWITITTPVSVLILFFFGCVKLISRAKNIIRLVFMKKALNISSSEKKILYLSPLLILPFLIVFLLKPTVYDGWRHFYFIYPLLLLIVLLGINFFLNRLQNNSIIFFLALTFLFIEPVVFSLRHHPNEFVYFNSLAGKNYNEIKMNYELDYWGVSNQEVLEKTLHALSGKITIFSDGAPAQQNYFMLPTRERERIQFVDSSQVSKANVFIGSYRWHPQPYQCTQPIASVLVNDTALVSAYIAQSCSFTQ